MKEFFAHTGGAGGINDLAIAGMLMSLLGVAFKIAAVPMHLYTPDVYEGAAAPVSAFLAFTPKTAGFISMILLCSTMGWTHGAGHSLPDLVRLLLWVMAALTMTVGNVLAILQSNVKRMLAYSSVAHSGYMLVALVAGPGSGRGITDNGLAAILFYLLSYGLMNLGAFAVLACLERQPGPDGEHREIETVDDLRGLCKTQPALGWTMVVCALSLLGFPPLLGFFAKVPLFTSAIAAGEIVLVVILGLNAAIAAYYYLRLVAMPLLEEPDATLPPASRTPFVSRPLAAFISAASVVVLVAFAGTLMREAGEAAKPPKAAEHSSAAK
jgi:NADH-quinone oxidoreductase subunit N